MNSPILHTVGRVLLPLSLLFSLYLLWRGHNEPGGGFVGGLVAAAGFTVHALPRGREALLLALRWSPSHIAATGLLLALVSGLPALLLQQPYLTHQWQIWDSGFALGSALLFDIGVYLAVIGAVCGFVGYYMNEND
jgi:multicomponent Na+:H+ antiporter subunit B